MKNRLYILLILSNILLLACSSETTNSNTSSTTPIESKYKEEKQETKTEVITPKKIPKPKPKKYKFTFTDLDNQKIDLSVEKNYYDFKNITQPIVLMNFFATWCPPCIGQIPHLNNIQKRYKGNLFIEGMLVHDNITDQNLHRFIASQKINFFISNNQEKNKNFSSFIAPKLRLTSDFSLPLMILFVNGKYYTHYEGSIPEEMIESDIKQALKNIKR